MKKIIILFCLAFFLNMGKGFSDVIPNLIGLKAVLGEAEGENLKGKLAIAETLRNRGHIKGVYGINAIIEKNGVFYRKTRKGLRKIDAKTVEQAKQAWKESSSSNITKGATGWGSDSDIKIFIKEGWWHRVIVTKKIGSHTFYKEIRK